MLIKVDICQFYHQNNLVYFIARGIKIWPFVQGSYLNFAFIHGIHFHDTSRLFESDMTAENREMRQNVCFSTQV